MANVQSMTQPTIFVVEDDESVRNGIKTLLETLQHQVQVFESADEFVQTYDPKDPGCLILDLQMPGMSGLELQRLFHEKNITLPIIIITGHGDIASCVESLKMGVVDFMEKPFRTQVLLENIHKAIILDAEIRVAKEEEDDFKAKLSSLTKRERQIMNLLVMGKTDKEIAFELAIGQRAASFHRLNAFKKTGIGSIAELVHLSVRFAS